MAWFRGRLDEHRPPGRLAGFVLLFVFAKSAADLLGLTSVSDAITLALRFLPRLITALAILLVGGALATFVGKLVQELCAGAGIEFGKSLGSVASGVTALVLTMMALAQLGIDTELLRLLLGVAVAGVMLAIALSFGLGSRELTRNIIAGFYARRTFQVGEPMTLGTEHGMLAGFTATHTLLRQGDTLIAVPNTRFLEGVATQR